MQVRIVERVSDELVDAFQRLVPQLSSSAPPLSADDLRAVVDSEACTVFVAEIDGRIVGTLTLALFRIPTGVRAWIEDVVVDDEARGQGVGAALNRQAIDHAAEQGARTVDLTSRPSREAANALYRKLGFVQRETNVYRYEIDQRS